jgi:hypothetical protein
MFDLYGFLFINPVDKPLIKIHLLLQHTIFFLLTNIVHAGKKKMLVFLFNVLWVERSDIFSIG